MNAHPMEILLVEDNEDDILLEQEALADVKLVNLMSVVRDGEEAMAYLRLQLHCERSADRDEPHPMTCYFEASQFAALSTTIF